MTDWKKDPQLASLLERAKEDLPSAERLAGVLSRLEGEAVLLPPVKAPPLPGLGRISALALAASALVALATWLVVPVAERPVEERPVGRARPTAAAPAPTPTPVEELAAPAPTPTEEAAPPVARRERVAPTAPTAPTPREPEEGDERSTLRFEIDLLERATAARSRGDLAQVRALVEEHRRRFPEGVMRAERERLERGLAAEGEVAEDPE